MEEQVLQLVEGTLRPDSTVIRSSEHALNALYPNPQFPFALLAIATNTGIGISSRKAALTTLKTYISGTWSPVFDETFLGNLYLDSQAKSQIRDQVFNLAVTQDAHQDPAAGELYKIAASVTSRIATADFPDEWPNLLSSLLGFISTSESDSTIQSSLTVLADLIDAALTEDQFFGAARDLVNSLYHVAANANLSLTTRALSLNVFQACFGTLEMVLAQHGKAVRAFLDESLKSWVAFLISVLREPLPPVVQAGTPGKLDLRRGVITLQVQATKTLDKIRHVYSAGLTPYSLDLFQVFWERLHAVAVEYTQFFVTGQEEGNLQGDDGLPCSLDALVMEEIDFFSTLLKAPPVRAELDKQLQHGTFVQDLLRVLAQYSCVPDEGAEMWEADPEIYLTEMNLVSTNYTARSACADLVTRALYGWLKENLFEAMLLFDPSKTSSSWKEKEAFLFLLNQALNEADMASATLPQELVARLMEQASRALQDSSSYVRAGAHLALGSLFMVAGDGFVDAAAGAFANAITSATSDESDAVKVACFSAFADYIHALPARAAVLLQLSAIDSVAEFIHSHDIKECFEDAEEIKSTLIIALRDAMLIDTSKLDQTTAIDSFFILASNGATTDNTTIVILSTESFERIVESVASHGEETFTRFCSRTLPVLTGAFDVADMTQESNLTNLAAELVSVLAEFGCESLPGGFVAALMPKLQRVLMTATADSLVQPATRAVQYMLSKGTDQFVKWKDQHGTSSLEITLAIINRLLNAPEVDENAAQEVGGLATAVVEKYGPEALGPYLVELLRALATRLATAERIQFIQSLCMVFVSLSTTTAADVVTFLSQLDLNGRSGLDVVLTKWLENSVLFAGFEDVRKNIVALSKLFDLQDERIKQIGVKGELIVENTGRIKTRSQAKLNPDRYTTIPADLKILKLLVDELVNAVSASKAVRDELMNFAESDGTAAQDRTHDDEAVEYLATWFRAKGAEPGFQDRFALLTADEQQKLKSLLG
ncbi:hypothetical protein DV735_g1271, partial [Chaetothyriales sp. CBS 134920]